MPRSKKPAAISPEAQAASDSWTRFTNELTATRPASNGKEAALFKARAILRFDPRYAVKVLSSLDPSFFGLREVLFAGLCTWIIAPEKQELIRRSMLADAFLQLQDIERKARNMVPDYVFADVLARVLMVDHRFFTAIYYPLMQSGSIDRWLLQNGTAHPGGKEVIAGDIRIAISVLKVLHHHFTTLRMNTAMGRASLSRAYVLAGEFGNQLGGRSMESRHILSRYRNFKKSVAFAYAADSIVVSPDETLLEAMIDQRATFVEHGHFVAELFGRAAYIRDFLGYCADKVDYETLEGYLDGVAPIAMPEVDFPQAASTQAKINFMHQPRRSKST